jgi:myo-inositol-1(or 4)-monophosphatase
MINTKDKPVRPIANPQLQAALNAAYVAGEILRRKFSTQRMVINKGPREIVTDADLASQIAVQTSLSSTYPDYRFVAEENHGDYDLDSSVPTWIVDPLDGTSNYAQRIPFFCVSIALVQGGEIKLGVVHAPMQKETFFAVKDGGAYLLTAQKQTLPVHVSQVHKLSAAMIAVDFPRAQDLREEMNNSFGRLAAICRSIRIVGSAAMALAYTATGRLDGYYHIVLQPWDVAAGAIILTEADGTITTPSGDAWQLGLLAAAASNGHIHPELLSAASA